MSAAAQNTTQPLGAQNGNAPIQAKPPSFLQKKGLLGGGMNGKGPISSPTDNVMSPCSAKLSGAKQRHFTKAKPVGIASQLSQLAAQHQASPAAKSGDKPKIDF